jgi:hypothetical protein
MSDLKEVKPEPNQTLINMLESLVKEAKSGRIQSAAVCAVYSNAVTGNCFVGKYCPTALVGELRTLERDIIDLCIETRRKPLWECCE